MKIEKLTIKGFRNFIDTTVNFADVSLLIGKNDIGKSNLIYALRLLFDKRISDSDLDLCDADYNIFSKEKKIEIKVLLSSITESCLLSNFKERVKDGKIIIKYTNSANEDYKFYSGYSDDTLSEMSGRTYIKRLDMKIVDSERDLFLFYKSEKKKLLLSSKDKLSAEQSSFDDAKKKTIQQGLNDLNNSICGMNYIKLALSDVNDELKGISNVTNDSTIKFTSGQVDADRMLDNIVLASCRKEGDVTMGGDGRNNQIFLATWMAQRKLEEDFDHVSFFAIEEPEAHLHPSQQRKLASYLLSKKECPIIITSHSTDVVCSFLTENIIRLSEDFKTRNIIASSGLSEKYRGTFDKFAYRLNPISADTFFSDGVLLVEGVSEVLFYKSLGKALGTTLEDYNLSILAVEGVGFKGYIEVCKSLNIPFVIRTDNDVFQRKETNEYYFAGVTRALGLLKVMDCQSKEIFDFFENNKKLNSWNGTRNPTEESLIFNKQMANMLSDKNIYLSMYDLETDLARSEICDELKAEYSVNEIDELVKMMQFRKGDNMFHFLSRATNLKALAKLKDNKISAPYFKLCSFIPKSTDKAK